MAATTKSDGAPAVIDEAAELVRLHLNPSLKLVQARFMLTCSDATDAEKNAAKEQLLEAITANDMAPFYKFLCTEHSWKGDVTLLGKMETANAEEIKKLTAAIADAQENMGETEVRETHLAKAEYLCIIGDKEAAVTAFRETTEKTVSLGQRLDVVFNLIRLGMFYSDNELTVRNLEKAESLMEEGGDWDRRNRLKVYRGTYQISVRQFSKASDLFLATVSTFTSTEIMSYQTFVEYTVLVSMLALSRVDLHKKVVLGPEIQEMLHQSPMIKKFLDSFYSCDYATFFVCLAKVDEFMMKHQVFAAHRRFYIREMRILAYTQLLQSYRSVTLESMAKSFGVSADFIDGELSHFISAKRINCKIDKVAGIVMTNRPDTKNAQYQATIKQGDITLNQLQKLSQVINI